MSSDFNFIFLVCNIVERWEEPGDKAILVVCLPKLQYTSSYSKTYIVHETKRQKIVHIPYKSCTKQQYHSLRVLPRQTLRLSKSVWLEQSL